MSQVPEFAAFPRFRELNIKNLLYYQAEIELLRQKIEKEEEEQTLDVTCYINIVKDGDSEYHGLLFKLRNLLHAYSASDTEPYYCCLR